MIKIPEMPKVLDRVFDPYLRYLRCLLKIRDRIGFTLIEMLVVATIIGVLATIGLVNYQSLNRRARDGKRKTDLEQVRSALEIYRADYNQYPTGDFDTMIGTLQSGEYINFTPSDPKGYSYYYEPSGDSPTTYKLCAYLEAGGTDSCGGNGACGVPETNCNYEVQNP